MKKKVLFMGKLYDLSTQTLQTIQDDIHYRILNYTKIDIPVSVSIILPNQINITLKRNFGVNGYSSSLCEQDMYIISGEGYKGYMPKHSLIGPGIPHFPNIQLSFDISDYIKVYKKNIVAEKASRVKNIDIEPLLETLSVTFSY